LQPRIILDSKRFLLTLDRLCFQLIENHKDFNKTVLIGVQPRGIHLSDRLHARLQEVTQKSILYGIIDPTFYRDDYRTSEKQLIPKATTIKFSTANKTVVLIDDVLFSGRTIRSALILAGPQKLNCWYWLTAGLLDSFRFSPIMWAKS
jgi:pyrimidine operon attenuation protein/uracil phosphoribosyltransferase